MWTGLCSTNINLLSIMPYWNCLQILFCPPSQNFFGRFHSLIPFQKQLCWVKYQSFFSFEVSDLVIMKFDIVYCWLSLQSARFITVSKFIFFPLACPPVHEGGTQSCHPSTEKLQGNSTTSASSHQGDASLLEKVWKGGKRASETSWEGGSRATQAGWGDERGTAKSQMADT